MDVVLDTQLISYAMKGVPGYSAGDCAITSVTAQEFLLLQSEDPRRVRYRFRSFTREALRDPDLPRRVRDHERMALRRFPSIRYSRSDFLIIELTQPPLVVVEQWHNSITRIINGRSRIAYLAAIAGLPRAERRLLRDRFDFLLDSNIVCVALNKDSAIIGLEALAAFLEKNNAKKAIRNTLNDMFILGIVHTVSARLLTEDRLLGRFAAEHLGARETERGSYVDIDFGEESRERERSRESKGYINSSWRIRRGDGPWL